MRIALEHCTINAGEHNQNARDKRISIDWGKGTWFVRLGPAEVDVLVRSIELAAHYQGLWNLETSQPNARV